MSADPSCHACGAPVALGEPVALYHARCDPIAAYQAGRLRGALQRIVQVLGPLAPTCPGCSAEIGEAVAVLAEVGITYQPRK